MQVLLDNGFDEAAVVQRFDSFLETTKERVARKYKVTGVNVSARRAAGAAGRAQAHGAAASGASGSAAPGTSAARRDDLALAAAAGGIVATIASSIACVGPLMAIVFGIGGFGFLTRYSWLRVPASLATVALVGLAFYLVYRRPAEDCDTKPTFIKKLSKSMLWVAAAMAIGLNVFEYVIFPRLG